MYVNWKMALEKSYWQQKKNAIAVAFIGKKCLQIESEKWFLESCYT